jgi:hypothetical protein
MAIKPEHETANEIYFLSKIGSYADTNKPRADILKGYLAGCAKRVNWDAMDKARVMAYASSLLDRELGF